MFTAWPNTSPRRLLLLSVVTVRAGANNLASLMTSLATRCPNAKFSLSGYSKGALVLHQTDLPANVQSRVVAVAVFGVSISHIAVRLRRVGSSRMPHPQDPSARTGSQGIPLNDQSCFFAYCVSEAQCILIRLHH